MNQEIKKYRTVADMFISTCEIYDREAFFTKEGKEWNAHTHVGLLERATALAVGLYDYGFRKGDRIGLLSENRVEWVISDMAIAFLGAVSVPVFPILTSEQLGYIFKNCEASAVIVSNRSQAKKIDQVRDQINTLRQTIVFEDRSDDLASTSFDELISRGIEKKTFAERMDWVKSNVRQIREEDLFTLIYTSGTTGKPKGVMLSHKNLCTNIDSAIRTGSFFGYRSNLSYLPFCHAYERIAGYYVMFALGSRIYIAESIEAIASNIMETKPELMSTVPKLMEKVKHRIFLKMQKEEGKKRRIFNWAISIGKNYVENKQKRNWTPFTNLQYKLAKKLVFNKIKERLGGNLRMMVAGGAAMNYETAVFFEMLGVKSVQGYGLTEASPVISVNNIKNNELDTVGEPVAGVEVKIADDGEILARGENIMLGYWRDKDATEEVIDSAGWLHTGDIGEFTKRGNLKITDRKKNIFVSSGGKNIAPAPVENALMNSKYVEQVILIGEGRDYCTALIYPNLEELKLLAEDLSISYNEMEELLENAKMIKHIRHDLNHVQRNFAKFEQMRKFKFLKKPLTVESGELSPKMSVKRHNVQENYRELIEEMY